MGDGVWSSSSWSVRLIDKVKVVLEEFAKFESGTAGTDWSRDRAVASSGRQTDVDIDVRRHVYEHVQIFCPTETHIIGTDNVSCSILLHPVVHVCSVTVESA